MPKLAIDEVLLLVDAYFQIKDISSSQIRKDVIEELSSNMRRLPFNPEFRSDPRYRSVSGMNMCLANVESLETKSLMHSSKKQRLVFEYYFDKQAILHDHVRSILSVCDLEFPLLSEFSENIQGTILPSYYRYIENNDRAVLDLKKHLYTYGRSSCCVCGDDLKIKYGEDALDIMEIHLNRLLSQTYTAKSVNASELVLVCPNCHRIAHLRPENYTLGFYTGA